MRTLLALLSLVALIPQAGSEHKPATYEVPEAYQLYSAALAAQHLQGDLLISQTTVPFSHCLDSDQGTPIQAAINSYKKLNRTTWQLQRRFLVEQQYKLVTAEEIEALKEDSAHQSFFWRFKHDARLVRFSAVGFNKNKTLAFFEMDVVCGGLCGYGQPFLLERRNGKWLPYSPPQPPPVKNPDGTYRGRMTGHICMWNY